MLLMTPKMLKEGYVMILERVDKADIYPLFEFAQRQKDLAVNSNECRRAWERLCTEHAENGAFGKSKTALVLEYAGEEFFRLTLDNGALPDLAYFVLSLSHRLEKKRLAKTLKLKEETEKPRPGMGEAKKEGSK